MSLSQLVPAVVGLLGFIMSLMTAFRLRQQSSVKLQARSWLMLAGVMVVIGIGFLAAGAVGLRDSADLVLILFGVLSLCSTVMMLFTARVAQAAVDSMDKLLQDAENASKAKSVFLASMSHELRTPLNSIIGYSEILQEEAQAAGIIPEITSINVAGRHLLDLINSILDLSKIEAGKMPVNIVRFFVSEMLTDVCATAQPLVDKNSNQLKIDVADTLGEMHSDITKVRQILFNLLNNAAKFTENGVITLSVVRKPMRGADYLVFKVSDTGIGMTPEQARKVFMEFAQADLTTMRRYGGSGLGLTICRRFCQLLGGDIGVDSIPGRGTTFTVQLPASVVSTNVVSAPDSRQRRLGGTLVLIIDDDHSVRDILQRRLTKEGYYVEAAATGMDGLRMARNLIPDIITLDLKMPGMDGWAVLSSLKSQSILAHIPVIIMSSIEDSAEAVSLGAADFLPKPIDVDRLLAVLSQH
jgi:signal transduction histidine kinase